jgi:hypothetical protein
MSWFARMLGLPPDPPIKRLIVFSYPSRSVGHKWVTENVDAAELVPEVHNHEKIGFGLKGVRGHTVIFIDCSPSEQVRGWARKRNHLIHIKTLLRTRP